MPSERIRLINSLVLPASVIADVGCDHALVAEYVSKNVPCERVIASDISQKCLEKAISRLSGLAKVRCVCCDGLAYECDEAIIAGMGGLAIKDILLSAAALPQTLILCPHRDCYLLRVTLCDLGYCIDTDECVRDRGKLYSVIRARKSREKQTLSELELMFGAFVATKSEALTEYLIKLYNTYNAAPTANASKIDAVTAALQLQGVCVPVQK